MSESSAGGVPGGVLGEIRAFEKPIPKENAIVLVTHYQRLLNYIVPDFVHVMEAGRIIKTGDKSLALELETRGYDWVAAEGQAGKSSVAAVAA